MALGPASHRGLMPLNKKLACEYVGDGTYIGRYRGFPVAISYTVDVTMVDCDGAPVASSIQVIAQLRYVGAPEEFQLDGVDLDESSESGLTQHIEAGTLRASFEENIAWLIAFEVDVPFLEQHLTRCFDDMIETIERIGGRHNRDRCHYCDSARAPELKWVEERVAQVCDTCLSDKLEEAKREGKATAGGVARLFIWGPIACLVGALCWGGLWELHGFILSFFVSKYDNSVTVPDVVVSIQLLIFAAVLGGSVGWIVGRARNAGKFPAGIVAVAASLGAVVLADAFTVWWVVSRDYGLSIGIGESIRLIPDFFFESSDVRRDANGAIHAGAAFVGVIVAATVASTIASKPK